jgi:hypothetical protein
MVVSIQNPAKCEIHAVIRVLHAKGETAAEIHRQLFFRRNLSVYGITDATTSRNFVPISFFTPY